MLMASKAKTKGSGWERQLAAHMNKFLGTDHICRQPLSGGGNTRSSAKAFGVAADLNGTFDLSVEAKRTERFTPHAAMRQAKEAVAVSGKDYVPVVIHRRNQQPVSEAMVCIELDQFMAIWQNHLIHTGKLVNPPKAS